MRSYQGGLTELQVEEVLCPPSLLVLKDGAPEWDDDYEDLNHEGKRPENDVADDLKCNQGLLADSSSVHQSQLFQKLLDCQSVSANHWGVPFIRVGYP